MFLRKIVFFLIAKLVFVQATYSDGQGDHQDLDLKFEPNMTSEDLLNYCYSHSTFCKIKHILRQTLRYNYSQNSEDTVRVLQWNILSQVLGLREFGNASSCPTEALLWVNRRCQILYEILAFKSDVMCFQEVDHFDFLSRALATQSYSGVFVPTTCSPCVKRDGNNGPDGCAILYSNHKYELLGKHELVYIHSAKDSISRQVALLVVLRNKSSLNKLCVATTHLKPLRGEYNEFLRNQQGEELLKFVTEHASDCPTVISGDFNAEPTEPVYRTMISDPQLNLNSAYNASNKEAKFTVWKVKKGRQVKRTLDYIFYTTKYLTVSSIVNMPREKSISKNGIPSFIYPSDHFSLITDFFFNKT
ncbi:nocturnin-like [Adelges cooleyi]|uniref:nocturnin-like n=1 Tax=Adelges cooleyi TaxID=133065 RepID=UPI00217FC246|nr:nocturnin-like [Adelges cooleyi]